MCNIVRPTEKFWRIRNGMGIRRPKKRNMQNDVRIIDRLNSGAYTRL